MERLDCRLNKNPEKKNDLRSWWGGSFLVYTTKKAVRFHLNSNTIRFLHTQKVRMSVLEPHFTYFKTLSFTLGVN